MHHVVSSTSCAERSAKRGCYSLSCGLFLFCSPCSCQCGPILRFVLKKSKTELMSPYTLKESLVVRLVPLVDAGLFRQTPTDVSSEEKHKLWTNVTKVTKDRKHRLCKCQSPLKKDISSSSPKVCSFSLCISEDYLTCSVLVNHCFSGVVVCPLIPL